MLAWLGRLKQKLQHLFEEYGTVALVVWFTTFGVTIAVLIAAISWGFAPTGAAAGLGTVGAAYAMSRATWPFRVAFTLAVTPFVANAWRRWRSGKAT